MVAPFFITKTSLDFQQNPAILSGSASVKERIHGTVER